MRNLVIAVNYNQEHELPNFLRRMQVCCLPEDVVIVDDGSTDQSRKLIAASPFLMLRHNVNRGIGAAIRTGINYAKEQGDTFHCVTIISSNGKLQPEEIAKISKPVLEDRADYAQGSRFLANGLAKSLPRYRKALIPILTTLGNILFKCKSTDVTCGFRCYNLKFLRSAGVQLDQSWLDKYELEYYLHFKAHQLNMRVTEVPITVDYSHLLKGRKSKITPIVGWWSILRPFLLMGLGLRR